MELEEECPICYTPFGPQPDGSFICKDGKNNSGDAELCSHYYCVPCLQTCYNTLRKDFNKGKNLNAHFDCPLCREDWTLYLLTHYDDEESDDEESDDEESDDE